MTAATPYALAYDFTAFQAATPTVPLPADKIEIEFNAIQTTTDAIITNLDLIQRSDGEIANRSVGQAQLKSEVTIGLNAATEWTTATVYGLSDTVYESNKVYHCIVAHISSTFASDLGNAVWAEILDFSQFITADQTFSDKFAFDNSVDMSDPGAGDLRFNNSTPASATSIAISGLKGVSGSPDISAYIASWGNALGTTKGTLIIRKQSDPSFYLTFTVTGAITDNSTWLQFSVTNDSSNGTLTNADDIYVQFIRAGDGLSNTVTALTSASNATAIDLSAGRVFSYTAVENTVFSFTNPDATGKRCSFELYFTQAASAKTVAWPASVDWPNGVVPDLTTNSEVDILVFVTIDGGTTWYGSLAMEALA